MAKPLPEPIVTFHSQDYVTFNWNKFYGECQPPMLYDKIECYNFVIKQGPMS